jgi:hypothetical protein
MLMSRKQIHLWPSPPRGPRYPRGRPNGIHLPTSHLPPRPNTVPLHRGSVYPRGAMPHRPRPIPHCPPPRPAYGQRFAQQRFAQQRFVQQTLRQHLVPVNSPHPMPPFPPTLGLPSRPPPSAHPSIPPKPTAKPIPNAHQGHRSMSHPRVQKAQRSSVPEDLMGPEDFAKSSLAKAEAMLVSHMMSELTSDQPPHLGRLL